MSVPAAISLLPPQHAPVDCKVNRCPLIATHMVVWPTKKGGASAERCRVHAREFAERHGLKFPAAPAVKITTLVGRDLEVPPGDPDLVCPWARCHHGALVTTNAQSLDTCTLCQGLGYATPPGPTWLESAWTLILMAPDRAAARLVAEGMGDDCARIVSHKHARFHEAVELVEQHLRDQRCVFEVTDRKQGTFTLHPEGKPASIKTVYPILILKNPAKVPHASTP